MRVNVRTILSTKCAVRMCEILVAMGAFALRETRKYLRIRLLQKQWYSASAPDTASLAKI